MKHPIILIVILAAVFLVGSSLFTLDQTQQAIIVQLGNPVGDPITEPGLHVKIPFIQDVVRFERRWLEFDGDPNQIPTKDKKYIWVDTYARWRISDPLRYYQAVRDELGAYSRLDDIVDGETRNAVASFDLIELVRSSNRSFEITEELEGIGAAEARAEVKTGREHITDIILEKAAKVTPQFGIELVDVRFKRINYVESVQVKVFERMISERQRIAEQFRSEGAGESARINGERERELKEVTSEAYRQAQEIKGQADAEAADIYAAAYNGDPEFYRFLKTMEVLRETMDSTTVLVLSADDDFLRYLGRVR